MSTVQRIRFHDAPLPLEYTRTPDAFLPGGRSRTHTRDAGTIRRLIASYTLGPNTKFMLEESEDGQTMQLFMVTPTVPEIAGTTPPGASGDGPAAKIAAMNDAASRFWAGRDADPLLEGRSGHTSREYDADPPLKSVGKDLDPGAMHDRGRSESSRLAAQNAAARKYWNIR